ncbi:hypothetical protein X762_05560 [Mesorhizobium sp. LSHC426A00]|nr:hypothetical protein X761_27625 [Mesorhizobium sp. LSHC424B00]ESX51368.1 hypothetical protein X762_05560 [Mesorhizobium sp. LSHC426A00]ESX65696.1 hypothetical protein X758_28510 [Mesorhizobium sp. LSHC416B00]
MLHQASALASERPATSRIRRGSLPQQLHDAAAENAIAANDQKPHGAALFAYVVFPELEVTFG